MLAPPLLVSYSSVEGYLSALTPELRDEHDEEIRALVANRLPPVVSSKCLSVLFGYSTQFVKALSLKNYKYYREFTIRKVKKRRKIQAPRVALKVIQKWFGYHLAEALPVDDYVYGFVAGRSAIDAAAKHCGSSWVYSVDIQNFFPSTKDDVVIEELVELGYSEKGAALITHLCCYNNSLGQGAPSSPVLSNLVMRPIDLELGTLADELGITFSRYADDIVFSGDNPSPCILFHRTLVRGFGWTSGSEMALDEEDLSIIHREYELRLSFPIHVPVTWFGLFFFRGIIVLQLP